MNPEQSPSQSSGTRSAAFYVLLATVVLAPLAFLPTPYMALEAVKTIVIVLGVLLSAILYGIAAVHERKLVLPPRSLMWTGAAIALSLVLSALNSGAVGKSFFGQGFEWGTASFLLVLLVSSLVAYTAVRQRSERAIILYVGVVASFLVLCVFHLLRLAFGASFLSFSILSSVTSTMFGNWYSLAVYAVLVVLITILAIFYLPLSRRLKAAYWILSILAFITALTINSRAAWDAAVLVFLGITIYATLRRPRPEGGRISAAFRRLAWLPAICLIVTAVFAWKGPVIIGPAITKIHAGYTELSLPWRLTLDVASDSIKARPLFGVGPNRFTQAYQAFKPAGVNSTDAWGVEFSSAFSTIGTFAVTQGLIGALAWILFFVFFGILGASSLRRAPSDPQARFILVSSYAGAALLWLVSIIYVPSHVLLLFAFVVTGIWAGAGVSYGVLRPFEIAPAAKGRRFMTFGALWAALLLCVVWGGWHLKKTVALAYFGSGVKQLTVAGHPDIADRKFRTALALDPSDVYWQARAEAGLALANQMLASSTQASQADAAAKLGEIINTSVGYARNGIAADPTNYYNYVSEARVSEAALQLRMDKSYENAVQAYTNAIQLNPQNPSLYLNLARLHASQNKFDEAVSVLGSALQVKPNYLDAIFLLSQVEAAQGKIADAITASYVAVQINPQNPILLFQLGLLLYSNKDYQNAAQALAATVAVQPDYANAQYFLGLAYAQIGKTPEAIAQFESLAASNPDNQEVAFILANLRAGRAPFANAQPPVATAPEKRSTLPLKEDDR